MYPSFPWLLPGTFISGGADETVRIWNIDQRTKVFEKVLSFYFRVFYQNYFLMVNNFYEFILGLTPVSSGNKCLFR